MHVIHIMQGTLLGTDSFFNTPMVQASTHYGIGKNGEIHQYVRDEDAAWGNGLVTNPFWGYLEKYPNVNPNLYTLSYELEGMSGQAPTGEQW
ncbi:MAG: N-acetylmuramoyl-L-alanine amidase, partial [Flavobacterium sp.]|nr:N-acetylmuramoyl-L-alanine amidase [Flavobacterium sp.]